MAPLALLTPGEKATVLEIREVPLRKNPRQDGDPVSRAEAMGLRVGKVVEVLNNDGRGPLLVKVDESRIAIARGMAMRIMVGRVS